MPKTNKTKQNLGQTFDKYVAIVPPYLVHVLVNPTTLLQKVNLRTKQRYSSFSPFGSFPIKPKVRRLVANKIIFRPPCTSSWYLGNLFSKNCLECFAKKHIKVNVE